MVQTKKQPPGDAADRHRPAPGGPPDISLPAMIIDTPFYGILAIDTTGAVTLANPFFLDILQLEKEDVLGRMIWDIIPGCSLYETILENHSHWGEILNINGRDLMVSRFPLKQNGRIVGAAVKTIFPDKTTARGVSKKFISAAAKTLTNRAKYTCLDIIGESAPMLAAKKLARRAARTDSTLLITGESGTGKEVFAQAIHNRSVRCEGPFVQVNCAAIPEHLLESELFGYDDGAFTGAKRGGKPGKFELADGGTILLDEIGDMPLVMQAKILRTIQEQQIERIGGTRPTPLNVRIFAATNRNLPGLVDAGKFRNDLYYRLKVLEIHIPPLRDRLEDIPDLVECLIKRINRRIGSNVKGIKPDSLAFFMGLDWSGNVRELANVLEKAINWLDEPFLDIRKMPEFVPAEARPARVDPLNGKGFHELIKQREREIIWDALEATAGNKVRAAALLKIQRSLLYKKIKDLQIYGDFFGSPGP